LLARAVRALQMGGGVHSASSAAFVTVLPYWLKSVQDEKAKELGAELAIELEPVKNWNIAEDYHQQYLSRGGVDHSLRPQSAAKGCTDPIRCYG
jgi:Peptide methionine sulfoxide reductase